MIWRAEAAPGRTRAHRTAGATRAIPVRGRTVCLPAECETESAGAARSRDPRPAKADAVPARCCKRRRRRRHDSERHEGWRIEASQLANRVLDGREGTLRG